MWERRYQAVVPTRTPGGERLYSEADVERLRLLDAAVAAGRRIGGVARLSTSELARLVDDDRAAQARRVPAQAAVRSDAGSSLIEEAALDRIRALDARGLDELLRRGAAVVGVPSFLEQTVAPLLRQIGEHWHAGRLSIATEHMASAVIEAFVVDAMRAMAAPDGAPSVVVAAPAGSRHVIAASLAAAAAAADRWRVLFLGGDLPVSEIARAAIDGDARAVALSVVYTDDATGVLGDLRQLREDLPADVLLIVGGRALLPHARALARSGIEVGETLDALRAALRRLSDERR
jgi:methanogenic corrinoid protein MtbC1